MGLWKGSQPFPKLQIWDSSNLWEFAEYNFKFEWNDRKFSQTGRKHCAKKEKLLITSNFSFSNSVFERLVLQTGKNQGLFGKGKSTLWEIKNKRTMMVLHRSPEY